MSVADPSFSIGVEEEYMLVDLASRNLVAEPPEELISRINRELGSQVSPELLRTQIEVGTGVCQSISELRADLSRLRRVVAVAAGDFGMAPIASSTHPFANWREQKFTEKDRYQGLGHDLQGVAARALIGGMHVHVGVENDDLRIDLLNQLSYFIPHLLTLSTSSPFWEGDNTGLMSYRTAVMGEFPRTGLPERFESFAEYQQTLAVLVDVELIEDGTMVWWDARLSPRFSTIEMRATDICTRIDDAICVAAIYRCVLRMLYRLRRANLGWRPYSPFLINENRWRARRYGIDGGLVDFGQSVIKPCADLCEELLELIMPDAEFFDCVDEVEHVRKILADGTSAHKQLRIFDAARGNGLPSEIALTEVVDYLTAATVTDLDRPG